MNIRSQFNQGLNYILLSLFSYFGKRLASRIMNHYRELLVKSLFESCTAIDTKDPDCSNVSRACEIFVEVAINEIASKSNLCSQSAAQEIGQLLIRKVKNRVGDSQVKIGLGNESNRAKWLEKTLGGFPSNIRILDAGAGEQQYKKYCGHLNYVPQELHRLPSVAERYASEALSKELITNSWLLQETLSLCAANDRGSSELLTYGLHVTARRI